MSKPSVPPAASPSAPSGAPSNAAPGAQKPRSKYSLKARTEEEEDAYDVAADRKIKYPSGFFSTAANLVKGALGSGILGTHVAYMKGGALVALIANLLIGCYIGFCYWMLAMSARKLYKRTRTSKMSYSDVGEAAFACSLSPKVNRLAKPFRYAIDWLISFELFGSCCCYQIIVAKTIKQLVEDTALAPVEPVKPGYPHLRVYLAALMIPFLCISLIRHLQWIAPLSVVGNVLIVVCIGVTVSYAVKNNPKFENLKTARGVEDFFRYAGMIMFSMSCIGVILPAENNIKKPSQYTPALLTAMTFIVLAVMTSGFFGYVAFLEKCEAPVTMNYSNTLFSKILKGMMAFMVYLTHALNFWVPFELIFYYIDLRIKNRDRVRLYEYLCRGGFCILVSLIAIMFPNVAAIMSFLGCFCLSNLIFIFPNLIYLLTIWDRPGLGAYKWRLLVFIMITLIGLTLFAAGSYVNGMGLIQSFKSK